MAGGYSAGKPRRRVGVAVLATLADDVSQDADSLDFQLDLVARLEPPPVAQLEDAARPDRARAEQVAGAERRVPGRLLADSLPREVEIAQVATRALLAVHARDHRRFVSGKLINGHDDRADRRREVLSLRR